MLRKRITGHSVGQNLVGPEREAERSDRPFTCFPNFVPACCMSNHRVTTFLGALDTREIVQIVRSSWNRVFVLKNEAHFSWKTGLLVINVWAWWSFPASCNNHYPPLYRNNRHINHLPSEQTTREWPCLSVLSHTKHTIKILPLWRAQWKVSQTSINKLTHQSRQWTMLQLGTEKRSTEWPVLRFRNIKLWPSSVVPVPPR